MVITYLLNCDYFRILDGLLEPLERVCLVALLPGDCRLQEHVLVPRVAGSLTAADPEIWLLYLFWIFIVGANQHITAKTSLQLYGDVDWLSVGNQLLLTADAAAQAGPRSLASPVNINTSQMLSQTLPSLIVSDCCRDVLLRAVAVQTRKENNE